MPTYEYKCVDCGRFEKVQPITADPLSECPTCGAHVDRLISRNVNIHFKGAGFHINDYRKVDDKSEATNSEAKGGGESGKPANGSASSTNSEAKSESAGSAGTSATGSGSS